MPLNSLPPSLTRTRRRHLVARMLVHTKDIYFVIMIIFVSVGCDGRTAQELGTESNAGVKSNRSPDAGSVCPARM